jgi:hypothetical protein
MYLNTWHHFPFVISILISWLIFVISIEPANPPSIDNISNVLSNALESSVPPKSRYFASLVSYLRVTFAFIH